jgi:hypothetical protein
MSLRNMRGIAAWLAVVAFVIQPQLLLAEHLPKASELPVRVVDVALGANGTLTGQLLDRQGRQLPISQIVVTNGQETWKTYTNEQGHFRLEGLVGSTYQVQAVGQIQIVRAWSEGTAPPQASKSLLLVYDNSVVLGQNCGAPVCGSGVGGAKHPLANPLIFGGLVAAAIAIPVAIHNSDDDPATP